MVVVSYSVMVEGLRSKSLYKINIWLLKVIPMILAAIYLLNTILSYCNIDVPLFTYIGGLSLLPMSFIYISSFVFKFCVYHRMFLYYIVFCDLINYVDYYIGIPVNDRNFLGIHLILAGLTAFVILFLRLKYASIKKAGVKASQRDC